MLADGLDAAAASYRVGYESPSQFSREYRGQIQRPAPAGRHRDPGRTASGLTEGRDSLERLRL